MRYKITAHPDVPLEKKTQIVEADGFARDAHGVTFHTAQAPAGGAIPVQNGRHEVAWFSKLAAVEIAKDEAPAPASKKDDEDKDDGKKK